MAKRTFVVGTVVGIEPKTSQNTTDSAGRWRMGWRVIVELTGGDGTVREHEVSAGGSTTIEHSPETIGLALTEGKRTLAGLRHHLVQAQAEDHCRERRRCSRCGSQRPVKGTHTRRLLSLFGTMEVRSPPLCPISMRRDLTSAAQSGYRAHARPMHARI
jgi:hypothetical protein